MRRLVVIAASLAAGLLSASPAAAQVPGGSTVAGDFVVTRGTVTSVTTGVDNGVPTTTITMGSPRAILDFASFSLPAGSALKLAFSARGDTALLRVFAGAGSVDGSLSSTVFGSPGGNVWLSAPSGITFGSTSATSVGGLHATTGTNTDDSDFMTGGPTTAFASVSNPVQIIGGAQITGNGGPVGFAGSGVFQGATSAVGTGGGNENTEAAYVAAGSYSMTLGATTAGDHELLGLVPIAAAPGATPTSIDLNGTTTAGDVYVVSHASGPVAIGGALTASRAPASGGGDVLLATGAGMTRGDGDPTVEPTATRIAGAAAQPLLLRSTVTAADALLARVTGDLTISGDPTPGQAVSSFSDVVLSTDEDFVNQRGSDAVDVDFGRFVIYAADPDTSTFGLLNSGARARWGATIDTYTPVPAVGHQYVFAYSPTVTFAAPDTLQAQWPAQSGDIYAEFTGVEGEGPLGAYFGDQPDDAFEGDPVVTSAGLGSGALVDDDPGDPSDGPYVVDVAQGSGLVAKNGYQLAFEDGLLDVLAVAGDRAPVVAPVVNGTLGTNAWYRSNVSVDWSTTDADGDSLSTSGCGPTAVTSDTSGASFTCTAIARGRRVRQTATVKRDATPPTLAASATSAGAPYAAGATAPDDVQIRFTCADALSGVAPGAGSLPVQTMTAEGETPQVSSPGTCADNAGNTTRSAFGPVRILRPRPQVPAGSQAGGSSQPSLPSAGQTRTALGAQVRAALATLRKLGLARLLTRGYTRQFAADQAGVAIEDILGASRGARPSAAKPVVLARGTSRFTAAGTKRIAVKLTKAGKRALRRRRSMKLTVRIRFRPASGATALAVSRAATVKRR